MPAVRERSVEPDVARAPQEFFVDSSMLAHDAQIVEAGPHCRRSHGLERFRPTLRTAGLIKERLHMVDEQDRRVPKPKVVGPTEIEQALCVRPRRPLSGAAEFTQTARMEGSVSCAHPRA